VLLISDDAKLKGWARVVGKTNGTNETLILLGIVVLKTDLKLDGFGELAGLLGLSKVSDCFSNNCVVNLCAHTLK
jgi:hypothetical protein